MKQKYDLIQLPLTSMPREMNKKEIAQYGEWFVKQIPHRMQVLHEAVTKSKRFRTWIADYSPESLEQLGKWFAGQVECRDLEPAEREEWMEKAVWWVREVKPQLKVLTDRTNAIAVDVGMYLSQVLIRNVGGLYWENVDKGPRANIDYGQPVVAGFRKGVQFNPVYLITVFARGLLDGTRSETGLRRLYEIWRRLAEE